MWEKLHQCYPECLLSCHGQEIHRNFPLVWSAEHFSEHDPTEKEALKQKPQTMQQTGEDSAKQSSRLYRSLIFTLT